MSVLWEGLVTGSLVGLMGIVYGSLRGQVNRLNQCKVSKELCDERHQTIGDDLQSWPDRFDELMHKLSKIDVTVARMDERLKNIELRQAAGRNDLNAGRNKT